MIIFLNTTMVYEKKDFGNLPGRGFLSDALLKNHIVLYEGYVKNIAKIGDALSRLFQEGKSDTPEFSELQRRFGWEWNGMRLHEYYFSNLSSEKKNFNEDSILGVQMKRDFGSFEKWQTQFQTIGAMRGIGWVILYFDPAVKRLFNVWVGEHDEGHLAGAIPILVLDVFEHAYMTDFGTKKADYLGVFMNAIEWDIAEKRYDAATRMEEARPKGIDHIGCRC